MDEALDKVASLAATPDEWRVYVAALELARGPVERWGVTWQSMFYYWMDCGNGMVRRIRGDFIRSQRTGLFGAEWLVFVFAEHGVWIGTILASLLAARLNLPWAEYLLDLDRSVRNLGHEPLDFNRPLAKDREDAIATYAKILEPYKPQRFAQASSRRPRFGDVNSGRHRWLDAQRPFLSTGPVRDTEQAFASYMEALEKPGAGSNEMLKYADAFVARNLADVTSAIESVPEIRVAFLLLAQRIVDSAPELIGAVPWLALRPLLALETS
jgi:hypothetical protein